MYLLIAGPQIGKVTGSIPRWLDFWVRVNKIDIPNSNIRTVVMDPQEKTVVPLNAVLSLNTGDILNVMMATETIDEGLGLEAIAPNGEPTIPSIIVTIVQLDWNHYLIATAKEKNRKNKLMIPTDRLALGDCSIDFWRNTLEHKVSRISGLGTELVYRQEIGIAL